MVIMSIVCKFIFPPSLTVSAMSAITSASMARIGYMEAKGKKHLQYSKFWNIVIVGSDDDFSDDGSRRRRRRRKQQIQLSSKVGMLLLYAPAFLAAAASFSVFSDDDGFGRSFVLQSALTLHFFKRLLEVLFVHKYSGYMILDTASAIPITLSYFLTTTIMLYAQHLTMGFPEPPIDLKYPGIVLFLIGISGNFYHHYLLSKLRQKGEKEYKIPKGGLFGLVVCPHYLFEILGFYGISFISQTIYAFSFALGTTFFLIGRSYATKRWYLSKFENFPRDVKALIPFFL